MTDNPLAALLAGVPRYTKNSYPNPAADGYLVHVDDVLAAPHTPLHPSDLFQNPYQSPAPEVTEPAPTDAAQTAGERLIEGAKQALAYVRGEANVVVVEHVFPDAAQMREAAIRECADALRKVIDYAAFAGADPDEVEDEAINSYADYLLTLIGEKPHEQRE